MRFVFAIGYERRPNRLANEVRPPNLLISYAHAKHWAQILYEPDFLLIDSGAFTVWKAGQPANLHGFAQFAKSRLQARQGLKTLCINLDVIPGEFGRDSTAEERQLGMAESLRNADILRGYGLPIVEVFHQDEPWHFLDQLLERLPPKGVLALSPRNDVHAAARAGWLGQVLHHLVVRRGIPLERFPRCHGLAATCRECLEAFPFYSADSSTWVNAFRYGSVVQRSGKQAKMTTIFPSSTVGVAQMLTTRRTLRNLMELGQWATDLWAARGITFPE